MKVSLTHEDVCRLESFLATDIASFSLWSSSKDGGHIDIDTGSDGNFKIIVYFNQNLSEEDESLVYKSERGIRLSVEDLVYVGSTEWMDEGVVKASQDNYIDSFELPLGNYVVDAYSLLIKDQAGKPKYIQFAFCIFSENEYVATDIQPRVISQPISLKYD